jgi:hypothetical protein
MPAANRSLERPTDPLDSSAMRHIKRLFVPLGVLASLCLTACGGGTSSATIGGTVTGLASGQTLTLLDNLTDTVAIVGNGSATNAFTFATTVAAGGTYDVTIAAPQPLGQTCALSDGSGTVDSNGDSVSDVAVACVTSASVAIALTGLATGEGVTLALSDTTSGTTIQPVVLAEAQNGSFAFPELLPAGNTFTVSVVAQPSSQTCTIAAPSNTSVSGVVTVVSVSCS